MMKKKIIITFLVMSMAVVANAALTVVIQDETGAWREYPDSTFTITPSTNIVWGIMDDGQATGGLYVMGVVGPGSISEPTSVASGVTARLTDDAVMAAEYGVQNLFVTMDLSDPVGGILFTSVFHCEGVGDVTLYALDDNFIPADTQVIHQIPEPATFAILGIGGLLLRKRRIA